MVAHNFESDEQEFREGAFKGQEHAGLHGRPSGRHKPSPNHKQNGRGRKSSTFIIKAAVYGLLFDLEAKGTEDTEAELSLSKVADLVFFPSTNSK